MFSIKRIEGGTIITVLGLKIKLTRGLRLEQDNGGPYGMYSLVKEHAEVPYCVQGIVVQHGWTAEYALKTDLQNTKTLMLCWNKRYKDDWRKKSQIRCEIVGAPFVHYRRKRKIAVLQNAAGTIAFPAHSITNSRPEFDIDVYCQELKKLPNEYQPVTICVHFSDITYGLDKEYIKRGFNVVCAGSGAERPFYEEFYNILRRHRFSTSNAHGSYIFYAVEMGIPFFFLGDLPTFDNRSGANKDAPAKVLDPMESPCLRLLFETFPHQPQNFIMQAQTDYVLSELGMLDCISKNELALALRKAAIQEFKGAPFLNFTLWFLKTLLRHPLHARELFRFRRFMMESSALLAQRGS